MQFQLFCHQKGYNTPVSTKAVHLLFAQWREKNGDTDIGIRQYAA